jgi:hypothetical protein
MPLKRNRDSEKMQVICTSQNTAESIQQPQNFSGEGNHS